MTSRNPHYFRDPITQDLKLAFSFPPQVVVLRTDIEGQSSSVFYASQHVLGRESEFFADMFAMPQPPNIDTFDGHPLIPVQDQPHELHMFLECLHDHRRFFLNDASKTYTSVAALLRLSTKYQVPHIRNQMAEALLSHYPAPWAHQDEDESTNWGWPDDTAVPRLCEVATLAQETNLVNLRAIIFYHMLIAELQVSDSLLASSPSFPLDQVRSLQRGKNEIRHKTLTLILDVAGQSEDIVSGTFCPYKGCDRTRRVWMNNVIQKQLYMEPRGISSVPFPRDICSQCSSSMKNRYWEGCLGIWKDLPTMFGLLDWDEFDELHRTSSNESG